MNMFCYQFFINVCICLSIVRFLRPVVTDQVRSGVASWIHCLEFNQVLTNIFAMNDGLIELEWI